MAGLSTYTINRIRDHLYRTATMSKVTTLWISLHTGDPGLTGLNEVTEAWYGRIQRDAGDANWDDAVDGEAGNIAAVVFGSPTGMGGSLIVTHVGVWEAETVGNFVQGGALDNPKTINNGDAPPEFTALELRAAFE
jgi:hypothetical protein